MECPTVLELVFLMLSTVGEFVVAGVIYYEWEGGRLDEFLRDADSLLKERQEIYNSYCDLSSSEEKPRNQAFKD